MREFKIPAPSLQQLSNSLEKRRGAILFLYQLRLPNLSNYTVHANISRSILS